MKRNIVLLGLALALVGCRNNDAQVPATGDAAAPSTLAQPASAEPAQAAPAATAIGGAPLPEGIVLDPEYTLRKDWVVPGKNGTSNRRTEFMYKGVDSVHAMAALATSMTTAGFSATADASIGNGIVRQSFKKQKYGTVFARAQDFPVKDGKPARGALIMSWPNPNSSVTSTAPARDGTTTP